MSTKLSFAKYKQIRWYSTKIKMEVIDKVYELLSNNEVKHRHHPGIMNPKQVEQPSWLLDTIKIILHDEKISIKQIHLSGMQLATYLQQRRLPREKQDIQSKLNEIKSHFQLENKNNMDNVKNSVDDNTLLKNSKVSKLLKSFVYQWKPVDYDKYTSLTYLVSRSMPEYSVLYKIFNEINTNVTNFKPTTLFDYGSGVGTVMWAASKFWAKSIKEYYCVDASQDMNELSEYLIKRAKPQINREHIFYRQFLPASTNLTYDIVVSAYSLLELPDQESRLQVISTLWNKTKHFLVIVERGTKCGFELINEARDFILNHGKSKHGICVFSPCPHDLECPAYMTNDNPCNFEIKYMTFPLYVSSMYKSEFYSYIVLKKEKRSEDDCQWPRIIRPVLKRSKHVICRTCTATGELQEQIFTAWKNGKNTYRCARSSSWGDRLPFKVNETEETEKTERTEETGETKESE